MISGDISDFQIDTSIRRNLSGGTFIMPPGKVWCLGSNDEKEQWIMVYIILMIDIMIFSYSLMCSQI
jgi:hypothetical protein